MVMFIFKIPCIINEASYEHKKEDGNFLVKPVAKANHHILELAFLRDNNERTDCNISNKARLALKG